MMMTKIKSTSKKPTFSDLTFSSEKVMSRGFVVVVAHFEVVQVDQLTVTATTGTCFVARTMKTLLFF
jgi:hypothetical protein